MMSPTGRVQALDTAMKRAGIASCALRDDFAAKALTADLPKVPGAKLQLPDGIAMIVTSTAVVVEGEEVVSLRGAELGDPAKLAAYLEQTRTAQVRLAAAKGGSELPLLVFPRPDVPWGAVVAALDAAKASYPFPGIVVNTDTTPGAFTVTIPEKSGSIGLLMVLMVRGDSVVVASMGGQEGTLASPLATYPVASLDDLRGTLKAVRGRHPDAKQIVVMADDTATAGVVVPVMEVAFESFPDVLVSGGVE
jgi:hypothetical protein